MIRKQGEMIERVRSILEASGQIGQRALQQNPFAKEILDEMTEINQFALSVCVLKDDSVSSLF